jgi:hypothetical protein
LPQGILVGSTAIFSELRHSRAVESRETAL